jgi:hypothetical protein
MRSKRFVASVGCLLSILVTVAHLVVRVWARLVPSTVQRAKSVTRLSDQLNYGVLCSLHFLLKRHTQICKQTAKAKKGLRGPSIAVAGKFGFICLRKSFDDVA